MKLTKYYTKETIIIEFENKNNDEKIEILTIALENLIKNQESKTRFESLSEAMGYKKTENDFFLKNE